ncbi:FprA family A-type flavoprotein [Pyrolobus fumarii]|nr:FprA family A-type flavoprotein [Pyrolobus fumarii]
MPRIRVSKVTGNVYQIRVDDVETRFFEGIWEIPEGVTYNAYLVDTGEKRILIDTVKSRYALEFLEALRGILDPRDIDAIIVQHSEPDHSGAFPIIYEAAGKPKVYAHPIAKSIIESEYGVRLEKYEAVRDDTVVDVGDGKLVMALVPWLHWPDTIITFYPEEGLLFTCDVFGVYGVLPHIDDAGLSSSEWALYERYMRKYFANIVGAYRDWVVKNLEKLEAKNWNFSIIAPGHGLVIRKRIGEVLEAYRAWGSRRLNPRKATIIYSTMYGAVEKAALYAAERLAETGFEVHIYGSNDEKGIALGDVLGDAIDSRILVLGVPVYDGNIHPITRLLVDLLCEKVAAGQVTSIISSYGWGPVAKRIVAEKLEKCGFRVAGVIEARGALPANDVDKLIENMIAAK